MMGDAGSGSWAPTPIIFFKVSSENLVLQQYIFPASLFFLFLFLFLIIFDPRATSHTVEGFLGL